MTAFIVIGVFNFCFGALATGAWLAWRRPSKKTVDETATRATPMITQAPIPAAFSLAPWIDQIEGDLSRHSFKIDEIGEELTAGAETDPQMVLAAAASILIANQQLQSQLIMAEQDLDRERQKIERLSTESRTDSLTGLLNRRGFDEALQRRFDQWRRHQLPLSLLLLDIDHFKQINDRYGHAVGDAALKWLAQIHATALRQMDIAARYGGEELVAILPGTRLSDAVNVAERLRATVAARPFRDGEQEFPITVSIGVASAMLSDDPARLVQRADEALYAAKQRGRNRAFWHNGIDVNAIQVDTSLVRHRFDTVQHVASYRGGAGIPSADEFTAVRCGDISAKGISLIWDELPQSKAFVVRLGTEPNIRFMVANVANVTPLAEGDSTEYRVGCAFVARLETNDADDNGTSGESRGARPSLALRCT